MKSKDIPEVYIASIFRVKEKTEQETRLQQV
jgi:hypothetical protein